MLGPLPQGAGGPFDLAFLDPPYRKALIAPTLESLVAGSWLAPGALLVIECAEDEAVIAGPEFATLDERTYGDTLVTFLARA
jgi:16S rRNA (guanine966-N2)-methyltransferase